MDYLKELKENPKNPRKISKEKYAKLLTSIKDFPQMLELRPIVYDAHNYVVGGNMRLRALKELAEGGFEVKSEYFKSAAELTPEQLEEFMIKDNITSGEWEVDLLTQGWDAEQAVQWGLDDVEWKIEHEVAAGGVEASSGGVDAVEMPHTPDSSDTRFISMVLTTEQHSVIVELLKEIEGVNTVPELFMYLIDKYNEDNHS